MREPECYVRLTSHRTTTRVFALRDLDALDTAVFWVMGRITGIDTATHSCSWLFGSGSGTTSLYNFFVVVLRPESMSSVSIDTRSGVDFAVQSVLDKSWQNGMSAMAGVGVLTCLTPPPCFKSISADSVGLLTMAEIMCP